MFRYLVVGWLVLWVCIGVDASNKRDPNDNKGNTPFFLQDPTDHQCLGPQGFTECSESALWMLTKRKGSKAYSLVSLLEPVERVGGCLQRTKDVPWWLGPLGMFFGAGDHVGMGSCSTSMAKSWQFEFVDTKHVKLSTKSGNKCLVRGGLQGVDKKHKYKSTVGVQSCSKGTYLPLVYHPTAVHEVGFYLKTADGQCFDGTRFKSCSSSNAKLFGIGVKYTGGTASRYFFDFSKRQECLVVGGKIGVSMGKCSQATALGWSLQNGALKYKNKKCLVRLGDDSATMVPCSEGSEHIALDVPATYTQEELEELLRNQDQLTPEQRRLLQSQLRSAVRR